MTKLNADLTSDRSEPRLAVIIPTHNRWGSLRAALESLDRSSYRNYEVIVIADGCIDGTVENCRSCFPDVQILLGNGDLWWGGAINLGLRYALGRRIDGVIWMNDDDCVDPGTLGALMEGLDRLGTRSIVCARVRSTDPQDTIEWVGMHPPIWHPDFGRGGSFSIDFTCVDMPMVHPPGGHCVLLPIEAVRKVGLIDTKSFPHYFGDHDYHYRAMGLGYRYFVARDAIVWNSPNFGREARVTLGWILRASFGRHSAHNLFCVSEMARRHSPRGTYLANYFRFLRRNFSMHGYEWLQHHPALRRLVRACRRGLRLPKNHATGNASF